MTQVKKLHECETVSQNNIKEWIDISDSDDDNPTELIAF